MSYDAECYCADLPKPEQCVFCEMETDHRLKKLAHNLAIAAGLCRAFESGESRGDAKADLGVNYESGHIATRGELLLAVSKLWSPGCGRSAP
jgi:hypothetical protein